MKKLFTSLILLFGVLSTLLAGTPVDMYLTGDFNNWKFESKYQFSKVGDNSYEMDLGKSTLLLKPGVDFKILSSDYKTYNYGTTSVSDCGTSYTLVKDKSADCRVESLILFSKVTFSTLTNEMILHCANAGEYSKTATLYIGAPCYYNSESIKFGAFATEADFNKGEGVPYAIVKAQKVPSMYIHGYQVYKAEIPFDERVYVASGYSSYNSGCKEFTEEGAWYCASPYPGIGGCYRSLDEARFYVDLIDLNFKPEANTLYVIDYNPRLTVYSSEYGIEQGKEINSEGKLGYTLKGKNIYYYPVTNVDIFNMVRYNGKDMAIDWNKPFFYEGERYASLKDVPVDELKETSCWKLWGFNAIYYPGDMTLYHVGNNVYKGTKYWTIVPSDEALDITLGNDEYNTSGACVRQIKAIATPEQTGSYNITFTYDANTQDLTHEWELVSADAISVKSSDIKGYFNGSSYLRSLDAKMELVGVNEYKYTCKVEMEKGLKYYTIVDDYSNFTAKDILFQIPETWLYEFTFTYNAATQKYACDVKKSYDFDPIYFRGTVNEWGVDEKYKLTTTDGDYYVATYAAGKEVELGDPEGGTAKFKIGSGNDNWYPIDFGYSKSQYKYLTAGTPCILASGGSDVSIVGSLKASKIEFTKSTGTLLVTAAQAESEYTTVYVVNEKGLYNIYAWARPINSTDYDYVEVEKLPKTYQGYEVYSYTFKSIYDQLMINGSGGNSINYFTVNKVKPYYYGGVWYETLEMEDAKPTSIYLVNTSGMDLEKITKYYSNLDRTGEVKQPVLISAKVAGYDVYRFEVDAVATGIVWYTPDYSPEIGYSFSVAESRKLTPYYANGVWYESMDDIKIDPKPEGPTVFDITTDQGVAFVVNPNSANPVFVPLTHNSYNLEFQTAQYTGTYTVTDLDFTAKIGGLTNFDVINYGTNGQALAPNYVYDPTRGASNGFRIVVGDYEVGDILNINATFDSYWNVTLIIDVTKILEPTPNDITLYYVNSNEWDTVNGYIWPTGGTGILEWPGAPATKIDKTVDGYDVYSYTFDSTKADNIIFNAGLGGAQTKDLAVNASKPYFYNGVWYETLTFDGEQGGDEGGDDTPVDVDYIYIINTPGMGLEKITKYYSSTRNTVSAKQPVVISEKAAGYDVYRFEIDADATGIKWFTPDCSSELGCAAFGVSQLERTTPYYANRVWYSSLEAANTWYVQFSGCDYVGCYPVREVQSGIYELKLENITQSCSYRYVAGDCGKGKEFRAITKSDDPYDYFDLEIPNDGGTYTAALTLNTNNWTQSLSVVKEGGDQGGDDTDPIVPETSDYVVRGNGGSDATGIWCGGIEWTNADSPVNNMTDADEDGIYEVTYKNVPAGTWNFKVVKHISAVQTWMGSDYLDTENSSAGYTTAPYDGNIGFTLNAPADVTVKFNTLTGKIIVTTPSGSFGKVVIEHFHILTGDNQCLDEFEFTEANNYTLVLTQEVVIDEESGVAYVGCGILGNCDYAVYEKYFSIAVTENGTYTVTVQFNGDYENPDFTIKADKATVTPPDDPEIWLMGQVTGYQFLDEWKFNSTDGDNYVIEFTTPKELTSLFRLTGKEPIMVNPSGEPIYSFAVEARTNIEANTAYTLVPHGGDYIGVEGIIEATRIEFQLSTGTFKVIGTSKAKVFDLTKDYNLCVNFDPAYPMTFKGNGVYTGTYVFPADVNGYKHSFVFGDVNDAVVAMGPTFAENGLAPLAYNTPIPLTTTYNSLLTQHRCYGGDTFEFTLTFKSDWTASVVVSYIPNLEGRTYTVNGNGGSDATGIWCGGIEWSDGDSPVNNMTDADADGIYEVTYKNVPAGTWSFKVVSLINAVQDWLGSDYLDTKNSSAGCTTAPYDGNIGFTLNAPADVTIKFNALTGKIIVTTPSGSFGKVKIDHFHITTGSEDVCLDQYEFTEANNYTLTFTEDIVVNPEYGYGYAYYRIIGNCSYAVYEKSVGIDVTVSGTYTVTIQFNGDYENPDFTIDAVKQGGSDEPVVPDPVISDITAPTFPQTEVGKASTATVTYTLENATSATVSIESEGEEAFFIQSQNVVKGKGSVSIMFMPETKGVHAATLVIKSGKVTETLRILAKAVDPAPEVLPVISDIDVPAFADTYLNETNVVTATYSLANATEATATISGANADAFYILSQSVGSVKILFMPEAKGTYNAILTITSGKTSESVNFTAKAIEFIPEPEPAISNVNVPAFATIEIGSAANVTATFTLENATEVSATLSGAGADAFILGQPVVNNGNGSIKIAFVPESAGTYTATLTLKSGKAVHTATITAVATEPAPQVRIENIQVPVFEEVYLGGYASVNVTYTLVNATKATVTVTGDVFTTGNNTVVGGKGTVPVDFMPETAGVHTATLTITAGGVSESVTLVAIAKLKSTDEPSGKVTISNLQVPEFASITAKETTTVTASYVLTGSTAATATISGTDAAYFTILSQTLSEGVGQVEIAFAPTVAREYKATMVVTSGGVTESIDFAATASEAPSISGLHVNDFGTVYVGEKVTVMANYSLAYAETATATLSGDTDVFAISRQMVSDGNGLVRIDFTPIAAGTYHATLTIKSGVSEESIDFSATAIKYEEPVIEPVISNLMVPAFGEVLIGETVQKIATYTLENATEATATLSGDNAFTITRTLNGAVRIMFAPTAAGTYNATLTITSGTVSESINFSATAIKEVEPEIEPIISNLMVPEFGEVLIGETVQRIATYTLENATEATATLSGDAVFTITRSQNGLVRIKFAPTAAGTYSATLTITSGKVSESIDFSAKAVEEGGEEPGPGPEDPVEPEKPDPLPSYPVRGYLYVVNTPDADLESMVKYRPVSDDKVDYFLAPEKTGQKIYGYDIYKFEVRDDEKIDLWEYPNDRYTSWHINVNADLSATPYRANGVWYASIEEMMTWYVSYIPNWDDEASEVMIEESPNVYVATFDAFAKSDDDDKYYYCLGNVEKPILEVGVSEYGVIQNYLQIPQGFKAMIYLDDTNWETAWKTYYKLVPPGDDWNRDCIDLGLTSGLCWATKNLGATEPQQEGTHFAWGEVEPKEDYSYKTYKWANLLKNNEYFKYLTDDYWGTIVDFRTTLEPEDDAANVALEGKWHMPTQADVEELIRECTTEFGSYYGVNGYFVTGPNGNAIFLPAVGIKEGTGYEESTRGGDYWTSSLYEDNQAYAVTLSFSLTYFETDDMRRTNGLAIRPVIHRDDVSVEEVVVLDVYAKDNTIYCEEPFQIYSITGLDVTHLNGYLEGIYVVKTEKGNQLISVW